jgi:hypothetical protein
MRWGDNAPGPFKGFIEERCRGVRAPASSSWITTELQCVRGIPSHSAGETSQQRWCLGEQ